MKAHAPTFVASLLVGGGLHAAAFVALFALLPDRPQLIPDDVFWGALFGLVQGLWVVPVQVWAVSRRAWGVAGGWAVVAVGTLAVSALCWLAVLGAASA